MRFLRVREPTSLVQGHTQDKQHGCDLSPWRLIPELSHQTPLCFLQTQPYSSPTVPALLHTVSGLSGLPGKADSIYFCHPRPALYVWHKEPGKWQVQTQKLNHRQSHPLTKPSWPARWHIQPQKTAIHEGLMTNVNTKSLNEPPPRTTWQEHSLRFSKPQGLPTTLTEHGRKSWQFPTRSPPAKYRSTADKGT